MGVPSWTLSDHVSDTVRLFEKAHLFKSFYIAGIEVTQAIQHYESDAHLTDANDQEANNAIRLVSNKPAWVRVYLGSFFGASGITGTLEVQRRNQGFLFKTVTTLNAVPPATANVPGALQYDYATNRGTIGSTLNFVIPANEMIGTLRLIARVSNGSNNADQEITVAVTLRQTLRLAGVMISYNGPASTVPGAPNLTIAAPTLANLQAMSATALTLFPVQSTANYRNAGNLTLTFPLIDPGPFPTSGCGASWDNLLGQVVNARTADGNQPGWVYYGLLPAGVPTGLVGGCGGGGVAVGPINQPGTLAHEAGHAAGLGHAPAGGAPNPDPNYPAYEPYDTPANRRASIGEYGLDINNGNIASPQTFRDFMAYGGPSWISLYSYRRLLSNAILNPATVGIDYPWWKDLVWEEIRKWPRIPLPDPPPFDFELELPMFPPLWQQQDMISLIVRVERDKIAEVMHVARTRMNPQIEHASSTPFTAQLLGEGGQVLANGPLLRLEVGACGCGQHPCTGGTPDRYLAQALIPNVAPGEALTISSGEEIVWERKAPHRPLRIPRFDANVSDNGALHLTWKTTDEVVEYWVRWSSDGENWRSLATGLTGNEVLIESSQLPSGKVQLQLVAHDGFSSYVSKAVEVSLPDRRPEAVIFHPVDGRTYVANQTLRLWGSVSGQEGEAVASERAVWLLDGRETARGLDTWISLEPGEHKLTLLINSERGPAEASVAVIVVDIGQTAESVGRR
jgi:Peptidase M66